MFGCVLQRLQTHSYDPNSAMGVHICARYGPDTLAIRRPTQEMIQRSIPVNAVETRQFRPKIASFHVSVCSCIIFLFTVVSWRLYVLVSFHVTI